MPTLEQIKKKIASVKELNSIVRVMKTIAATNIRSFEKAAEATLEYHAVINLSLRAVLTSEKAKILPTHSPSALNSGIVIFGSDLGLCGQFNDLIANFSLSAISDIKKDGYKIKILLFGDHVEKHLQGEKYDDKLLYSPSFEGLSLVLQELLAKIQNWIANENIYQIILIYMKSTAQIACQPYLQKLIPLDDAFLLNIKNKGWPSNEIPLFTLDAKPLLDSILQEYFFISLYEAMIESLKCEYTARLRAMSEAEKNINNFLDDLKRSYSHKWQEVVTEEILDIETGFESLRKKKDRNI